MAANGGAGAASSPYPVDSTLQYLLQWNNKTNMDDAFLNYVSQNPMPGNFLGAKTGYPGVGPVYESLMLDLQQRVVTLMGSWDEFSQVLGTNGTWIQRVPGPEVFEKSWITPRTAQAVSTA